jgi:hypothetical protein
LAPVGFAIAVLGSMLVPSQALAGEGPKPIRIDYSAPAACPNREALVAHVRARTRHARFAAADEPASELVVRVEQEEGRFKGRLLFPPLADGKRQERELDDAKCDDLVDALGFFIALRLEADAKPPSQGPAPSALPAPPLVKKPSAGPDDAGGVPSRPPVVAPTPPAGTSANVETPATAPTTVAAAVTPALREDDQRPRRGWERGKPTWRLGGGVGAQLVGGLAPTTLLGGRAVVELTREPSTATLLAPSVSLSALSTLTETTSDARGSLALRWLTLVGTICPITLRLATWALLRPCSGVEVGTLRGEGVAVEGARRSYASWVAVGLSGRVEVPLASRLLLELDVGGAAPFERPRFGYTSGSIAFETPAVGPRAGLTLAFRQ